jgi:uncharacterized protein (DUF983 family)
MSIATALGRGWSRRCPHCGKGHLFDGWRHLERCPYCGLVYERNAGDTWAFTVVGDRIPIALIVVAIYFGVVRTHRALGLGLIVAAGVFILWTAPNRWGIGIALHYLSRRYFPDPDDPVPPEPS